MGVYEVPLFFLVLGLDFNRAQDSALQHLVDFDAFSAVVDDTEKKHPSPGFEPRTSVIRGKQNNSRDTPKLKQDGRGLS